MSSIWWSSFTFMALRAVWSGLSIQKQNKNNVQKFKTADTRKSCSGSEQCLSCLSPLSKLTVPLFERHLRRQRFWFPIANFEIDHSAGNKCKVLCSFISTFVYGADS